MLINIVPNPPKAANLRAFLMINNNASLQAAQKLFPLIAIFNKYYELICKHFC